MSAATFVDHAIALLGFRAQAMSPGARPSGAAATGGRVAAAK